MRNNMQRTITQKKLNNTANDILNLLNNKYNNIFVKIEKFSGSLRYSQSMNGKNLNQQELIYEVSKNRLPNIKLTDSSKKADYIIYDKDNNKYYVETKSLDDNLLCEMYNLSKSVDRVEKFEKLCFSTNENPQEVFNKFKDNFLQYKNVYINQIYNKLPDFFVYHKKGIFYNPSSKSEFLSEYDFDLIFRHDAGGLGKYNFERPSIVYLKK